jgi:glutamine---fructose-6-phosphate transaminase (isomerizing)
MTTIMRSEILEQPEAISKTIDHVRSLSSEIKKLVDKNEIKNIIFFARGTSDNVAMYGFYLFATTCGISATSGHPSLATSYRAQVSLKNTLAIGISQSGKTAEIVESLQWAKLAGAATIGLTNTPNSPIFSAADLTILTQAGEERAVPATKTFTSALTALAVIAEAINASAFKAGEIDNLPMQISQTFDQQQMITQLASVLTDQQSAVITGRGFSVAIASEIALKLQESCYLVSIGLSAADLQHGPKAIVDKRLPILAFLAGENSPVNQTVVDLVSKLRSSAADLLIFGPKDSGLKADLQVVIPDVSESLIPILMAPPAQLMVEATAVAKGINPDLPRGLTKVTQT